ncbi:MAG: hypothetical protein CUN55_03050 [Phototrophicales bacterium]|nr:MAG: hypothetical protein CUN55_03050 [Phototrophicales bacterium]
MIDRDASQYGLNLAAAFMILVGWGGIFILVRNVIPEPGPRWLFFVLFYIATVGTSLPFIRFLNYRFVGEFVADSVILRESLWFGVFMCACAWLQIARVLTWPIALVIVIAIVVMETFLRLREGYYYDDDEFDPT